MPGTCSSRYTVVLTKFLTVSGNRHLAIRPLTGTIINLKEASWSPSGKFCPLVPSQTSTAVVHLDKRASCIMYRKKGGGEVGKGFGTN